MSLLDCIAEDYATRKAELATFAESVLAEARAACEDIDEPTDRTAGEREFRDSADIAD